MKAIVKVVSTLCLGMLLSMTACNNKSDREQNAQSTMDSMNMDTTQSQMPADTMSTDSVPNL